MRMNVMVRVHKVWETIKERQKVAAANIVQYRLERMVNELDDLEHRGIFTCAKIAEIVKKRQNFKYRLKRSSPLKEDFLAYFDYEVELDELRSLRRKTISRQLDKKKKKLSFYFAGVVKIVEIYRLATLRFKGDINMWFRYLELCRVEKAKFEAKGESLSVTTNIPRRRRLVEVSAIEDGGYKQVEENSKILGSYNGSRKKEELNVTGEPETKGEESINAGKLSGDYKTGKRINMKKVIPRIASHYRKDKIWMRRTKPNKRDYQVVKVVDDSRSMSKSECGDFAIKALTTVCGAMSQLEMGSSAVVSFKKKGNIEMLHDFEQSFTIESGSKMISGLTLKQDNLIEDELIVNLQRNMNEMLKNMASTRQQSNGSNPLQQLVLVIGDDRDNGSDHEVINQNEEKDIHKMVYVRQYEGFVKKEHEDHVYKLFKKDISPKFEMLDLGKLMYYLSIEVTQGAFGMRVNQEGYAQRILINAKMDACNLTHVPMKSSLKVLKAEDEPAIDATEFRKTMGCLRYMIHTRFNLCYVVGVVSRYMQSPRVSHGQLAKPLGRIKFKEMRDLIKVQNIEDDNFKLKGENDGISLKIT